jgi:chorismate mutase
VRNPFNGGSGQPREPASVYHDPSPPQEIAGPAHRAASTQEIAGPARHAAPATTQPDASSIDLQRRRDQLTARVAELQWDLGGLVYEMAIRDRIRVDVIVKRAAALQDADAELNEVERILRMEQTGTAGVCSACGAPHSNGAVFCWQCGHPLLEQVSGDSILAP